jgi:hypothetical protein
LATKRIDLTGLDAMTAAALVWGVLILVALLFLLVAGSWSRRQHRRQQRLAVATAYAVPEQTTLNPADRARLRSEAGELVRQAAASAVAAKSAQAAVVEARSRAHAAQQAREAAWRVFDAAQQAYTAARSDNGTSPPAEVPAEPDEDNREVTKAALAAYRRGDISVEQLNAVFRQATGWDPDQETRAKEIEARRAAESRARRLYQAAAAAERSAHQAADIAAVAARALAEESVEVAAEAKAVREALGVTVLRRPVRIPRQRR